MSQSHNPKDNQALLQSMLQRLKLQPGRESQACLHTPVPVTSAPTLGKNGERGAANFQKVNNSPINVFGANGIPTKSFGISAADSNFGFKDRERQQPGHSCELDSGLVSFPSHKDNTDKGENRVFGQATLPGITHTGTGQLFPAKSLKDADITSFERTDGEIQGETGSFGSIAGNKDAVTTTGQNQEQGFTPRVYLWSLKGADLNTGGQENKVLHVGNGGIGASAQSKDTQIVQTTTANSSSRRKQRSSDNKTRRWTQKIKERWRERPGSFGKRGKEEGVQGIESSPQTSENLINTSNKDGESIFPSLDSSATSETPPAHSEEQTSDGHIRSSSDFDFGLGSFSLLEEIVTGQEWAKFLNPAVSAPSANQRPSEEPPSQLKITPNPYDSGQSSLILSQQGDGNNQWSFRGSKSSPPADTLDNPALRSRVHLNRKRQHRSAEGTEASISSLSIPSSHVMDETGVSYHDNVMSPPSHSPSSFTPCGPAPQGVLKQSISRDSVSSMETLTKRRRVEENRRVHFSEQVVAIAPAELDMDATDSEDDLGAEEDSVIEQEFEVEQAAIEEEVPPARRPVLPAWILALKRMNTGRKHR
eukprot:superscaffoldBa00005029_g19805